MNPEMKKTDLVDSTSGQTVGRYLELHDLNIGDLVVYDEGEGGGRIYSYVLAVLARNAEKTLYALSDFGRNPERMRSHEFRMVSTAYNLGLAGWTPYVKE